MEKEQLIEKYELKKKLVSNQIKIYEKSVAQSQNDKYLKEGWQRVFNILSEIITDLKTL